MQTGSTLTQKITVKYSRYHSNFFFFCKKIFILVCSNGSGSSQKIYRASQIQNKYGTPMRGISAFVFGEGKISCPDRKADEFRCNPPCLHVRLERVYISQFEYPFKFGCICLLRFLCTSILCVCLPDNEELGKL